MNRVHNIFATACCAVVACGFVLAPHVGFADNRAAAEATLTEYGLVQQQHNWLLPIEVELQQSVRQLPRLSASVNESHSGALRLAQSLLAENARSQSLLAESQNNLNILQAGRERLRNATRQKLVDARILQEKEKIAALSTAYVDPERIADLPAMRQAMIQLTNSRNDLSATLMWIHDTRPVVREQYDRLSADRRIAIALERLGKEQQLGSEEDYDSDVFLRKLSQYEQQVFTDELPLYRVGEDLRVAAFINRTPVTFTWHTSGEPTMLPASVIEATGLKVPADAPKMKQRFGDGRELTVRQFEIPYLRFGRHVLKNTTALALPPEGEQYGAQIGPAAFEDHSPIAQPEKMRLVIR